MNTEQVKLDILSKLIELNLGDLFNLSIAPYEIVISGSFIAQCVLHENYDLSDIDIYVKDRKIYNNIINYIESVGALYLSSHSYPNKIKAEKYITPHANINLLFIKGKEDIINYINETSDLDICASYFDGFHLYYPFGLLDKRINIINMDKISIDLDYQEKLTNFLIRDFGSPLSNEHYFSLIFAPYHHRILRIEKYKARGFIFDDDELEMLIPKYYENKTVITSAYTKFEYLKKLTKDSLLQILILCLTNVNELQNTKIWRWKKNKLIHRKSLTILSRDKRVRDLWKLDT